MSPDNTSWQQVAQAFDRVAELSPDQRRRHAAYTGLPAELRAMLERMLEFYDTDETGWLDRPVWSHVGSGADESALAPETLAGTEFGNWRALEEIGRGGMAVVLRGERADGYFEKQVAIKLLPSGRVLPQLPARMMQEIRILARLQHRHIAGLIDGGVTDEGTPWLVMEYVEGVPITRYCREGKLDLDAVVALFGQVAEAVAHAHAHLVVHCDIKPSNVLVTADGQVKLVDFGISGLLTVGRDESDSRMFCTPGYAAPERLAGGPVSTAEDVFGLGALLYELLTGCRIRDMGAATCLMGGQAPESAPVPPSVRLAPGSVAGRWTAGQLAGDLDAICRKALATDPDQRYSAAGAIRADLERWRNHLPVEAVLGGAGYRAGKWLRRHRLPAVAGMVVAIALVAGAGIALWQADRARADADLARSVQDFMLEMFSQVDPWRNQQQAVTVDEVMDAAIARLPERLERHPEKKAEVQEHLGEILRRLGRHEDALVQHTSAADLWRDTGHPDNARRARTNAAQAALNDYDLEQAAEWIDAVIAETAWPPRNRTAVRARIHKAELLTRLGEHESQEQLVAELLAAVPAIRVLPDSEVLMADLLLVAAESAENRARYDDTVKYARQAADAFRAVYGNDHPGVGKAESYVATTRHLQGRYEDAQEAIDRSLAIDLEYYGADHPQTLWTRYTRSRILVDRGMLAEASAELENVAATLTSLYGPEDHRLGVTYANLGKVARSRGDLDAAIKWYARGLPITRAAEPGHPRVGVYHVQYARVLTEAGRVTEAAELFASGLALLDEKLGPEHPETAAARAAWADHLVAAGATDQALEVASMSLDILTGQLDEGSHQIALGHQAMGNALAAAGRGDRAREHWEAALVILEDIRHRGGYQAELDQLMARLETAAP